MTHTSHKPLSVPHIAHLANIPITDEEAKSLESAFSDTLAVIKQLKDVSVKNIEPTYQVTHLENVLREDTVDEKKMFSQKEALANAKKTYEGYIVVPQIIAQD
mgnify:CR=1 FL=1